MSVEAEHPQNRRGVILETVCHNDFSPLNVAFVDGIPASVFDFDQAAPGPRSRDLAYAGWLWLLGADIAGELDHQLVLLRTFLDEYGLEHEHWPGFGGRVGARVKDERAFHERAGRVAGPGSWLDNEIAWLSEHAEAIDQGLTPTSRAPDRPSTLRTRGARWAGRPG